MKRKLKKRKRHGLRHHSPNGRRRILNLRCLRKRLSQKEWSRDPREKKRESIDPKAREDMTEVVAVAKEEVVVAEEAKEVVETAETMMPVVAKSKVKEKNKPMSHKVVQ